MLILKRSAKVALRHLFFLLKSSNIGLRYLIFGSIHTVHVVLNAVSMPDILTLRKRYDMLTSLANKTSSEKTQRKELANTLYCLGIIKNINKVKD